jgi:hypothetical protein
MKRLRNHLTVANVLACVALFAALGGVSYAALKIPKNSVGSKQIKANAVKASKVKNGSLRKADFAAGQVPAGPRGPIGPIGPIGPAGTAGQNGTTDAFARVQADGTLEPGGTVPQSKGVDATDVQKPAVGIYCFGGLATTLAGAVVSMDNAGAASTTTEVASVAIQRGANLNGCDADHQQARVVITDVDPGLANEAVVDGRFTIWFEY